MCRMSGWIHAGWQSFLWEAVSYYYYCTESMFATRRRQPPSDPELGEWISMLGATTRGEKEHVVFTPILEL